MINMLFNGVPVNIMALAGLVFAFIMTCLLLVKCNDRLPKDQGREFAVNGALSAGKPRGAGCDSCALWPFVSVCELGYETRAGGKYLSWIGYPSAEVAILVANSNAIERMEYIRE